MDGVKKILMIVGLLSVLYFWKTYSPDTWSAVWGALFGLII